MRKKIDETMKKFRYPLGHEAGKTLTVGELRLALVQYSDKTPVLASWEGVKACVETENFKLENVDSEQCLIIYVDEYL